jgi:hypothetical protein
VDIFVGFAGRAHDARILANSTLFALGENGGLLPDNPRWIGGRNVPLLIIGDPAYPLLPWLTKPFAHRGVLNAAQRRFNRNLSRARMTIENSFGRLKGRWRCLFKKNDFLLENVNHVVVACCILHNVCEYYKEANNRHWDEQVREIEDEEPLLMVEQNVNPWQIVTRKQMLSEMLLWIILIIEMAICNYDWRNSHSLKIQYCGLYKSLTTGRNSLSFPINTFLPLLTEPNAIAFLLVF